MKTTTLLQSIRSLTTDVTFWKGQLKTDREQIGEGMADIMDSEVHKLETALMDLMAVVEKVKQKAFDDEEDTTPQDEHNRVVREGLR